MKLHSVVFSLAIIGAAASSGKYSYKPDSDVNPSVWPSIDLGEDIENQCGGSKQSGIDIPSRQCGVFDDYTFAVSPLNLLALENEAMRVPLLIFLGSGFWAIYTLHRVDLALSMISTSRSPITASWLHTIQQEMVALHRK
jgi:hypothetical protein